VPVLSETHPDAIKIKPNIKKIDINDIWFFQI
jgi:hypothetical protein